jgi:cobalt-zinc-cadmium efflux system outer membrane protein
LTSVGGVPGLARTHLAGDLEGPHVQLEFDEELQRLTSQSPEVAAAVADVARARWAIERAYAQVVPDISTQAAVMHNTDSEFTIAGVQISLPLPLWNKNQGGIRQSQEDVVAASRNVARAELDLRQRLATAFQQYADARVQVDVYSSKILPKAQEALDLVRTGFRAGEVGYLDLLTAQRTYFQTTLAYIDALRDLWRATVRIDGMLLEGSLQGGES